MTTSDLNVLSDELYDALRFQKTLAPLTSRIPGLTIDDAYKISLAFLQRRLVDGEHVVGKKIGVTSKAVQDMLDVREPDFGFLTNVMDVPNGSTVSINESLIQPRAEAEIALILAKDIKGPGVTMDDVQNATEFIAPCFEIVDSRIADWKIRIEDTVADNASCGVFTLGAERVDPHGIDLAELKVRVTKNGEFLSEGVGAAVQGSPLASVAWLANTLGRYGVTLAAGDIVLSGSLVPLEPARPGDEFHMDLSGVGTATLKFS
ncbi:MAG: 2-oxopent-4-enoate hydratase [Candidatus Marinimicrobia bacterium]|nr:2-oxopent-4-enoate hydratase [Candidatus Neomarinimicrobiota bacterium]